MATTTTTTKLHTIQIMLKVQCRSHFIQMILILNTKKKIIIKQQSKNRIGFCVKQFSFQQNINDTIAIN